MTRHAVSTLFIVACCLFFFFSVILFHLNNNINGSNRLNILIAWKERNRAAPTYTRLYYILNKLLACVSVFYRFRRRSCHCIEVHTSSFFFPQGFSGSVSALSLSAEVLPHVN